MAQRLVELPGEQELLAGVPIERLLGLSATANVSSKGRKPQSFNGHR